ncbi:hypothetical protein O181_107529 [Austropuccinia psidii MF-1]|uniref:Retrotransposon gag domain-containing protein n=1 Tax=Austropuccinia psidii MF-1 TaxID=1389203 RepID=A0A9Q3PN37_9BASI|nr:hypothetical protein [Austropuccinia psidii MF-1]
MINNWLNNQSLLSIEQKKELEMSTASEKEGLVVSTSSRKVQRKDQETSEEKGRSKEQSREGKRKIQLEQTLLTRVKASQLGTFSHGQNYTPLTEEKLSVEESFSPFLAENAIYERDIPQIEEGSTFYGEGEYDHIELIRKIDFLKEEFHIPDEMIVGKLHSWITRTAKKWYYKMRQEHGRNDWLWWKSERIAEWAKNSCRFKMENDLQSFIFDSGKDKPLTWFLKQTDRLSPSNPDMYDYMINIKILRKCGGEIEHSIKCRYVQPCSTEDYFNGMEDIINITRTGKTQTRNPRNSIIVPKTSREDRRHEGTILQCHKCGSTSHLANT